MFLKVERSRSIYWNQLLISKSSVAIIIKWEHLKQTNKHILGWGWCGEGIQSSAELFTPTIHSSNHHSSSGHFKDVNCQLKRKNSGSFWQQVESYFRRDLSTLRIQLKFSQGALQREAGLSVTQKGWRIQWQSAGKTKTAAWYAKSSEGSHSENARFIQNSF